eukprot:1151556_1
MKYHTNETELDRKYEMMECKDACNGTKHAVKEGDIWYHYGLHTRCVRKIFRCTQDIRWNRFNNDSFSAELNGKKAGFESEAIDDSAIDDWRSLNIHEDG